MKVKNWELIGQGQKHSIEFDGNHPVSEVVFTGGFSALHTNYTNSFFNVYIRKEQDINKEAVKRESNYTGMDNYCVFMHL